jgi:hypothetical protein
MMLLLCSSPMLTHAHAHSHPSSASVSVSSVRTSVRTSVATSHKHFQATELAAPPGEESSDAVTVTGTGTGASSIGTNSGTSSGSGSGSGTDTSGSGSSVGTDTSGSGSGSGTDTSGTNSGTGTGTSGGSGGSGSVSIFGIKDNTSEVSVTVVESSDEVTTGAWAIEDHAGGSCDTLSREPSVTGYNIGKCQGNIGGWYTSHKYTSCEMLNDNTQMVVKWDYYASSAYCSGPSTPKTTTYTGLQDGCKQGTVYTCGSNVKVSNYGSPQHIGNWNSNSCGGDGEGESEWEIVSYDSCTINSDCEVASESYSFKGICDDPARGYCFHVDSTIDYKGTLYNYEELMAGKEPECSVPHSPTATGVIISTTCQKTARVTDTHLMATSKGFQLAYSLKPGDVLYGDYEQQQCIVTSVQKEENVQVYFGLTCAHSEVLVSGLRASTFGDFHTLPSWYMTYVGGLLGFEYAASIGEYLTERYFFLFE